MRFSLANVEIRS